MNTDVKDLVRALRIRNPAIAAAGAAFAVALILFGLCLASFVRGLATLSAARDECTSVESTVQQVESLRTANPQALRERLLEAHAELVAQFEGFPTSEQATAELSQFHQYAAEQGVQLVRMETLLNTPDEEAQQAYQVQRLYLEAEGEVSDLVRFLMRVSAVPYPTFSLDNIAISPNGPALANADLIVYSTDVTLGPDPALVEPEMASDEVP